MSAPLGSRVVIYIYILLYCFVSHDAIFIVFHGVLWCTKCYIVIHLVLKNKSTIQWWWILFFFVIFFFYYSIQVESVIYNAISNPLAHDLKYKPQYLIWYIQNNFSLFGLTCICNVPLKVRKVNKHKTYILYQHVRWTLE